MKRKEPQKNAVLRNGCNVVCGAGVSKQKTMVSKVQHRFFLLFFLLMITQLCVCQKFELRANAYSGLFSFGGTGAVYTTGASTNDVAPLFYVVYPYGKKGAFSYAGELQLQGLMKDHFIFGAGLGYENLKSKVYLDFIATDIGIRAIEDKLILSSQFIVISPYIGWRFNLKKVTMDALAGVDLAHSKSVTGSRYSSNGNSYDYSEETYPYDRRPRLQLQAYYKRFGLSIGYTRSTKNLFHTGWSYLNKEVRYTYLRLGVNYKIVSFGFGKK